MAVRALTGALVGLVLLFGLLVAVPAHAPAAPVDGASLTARPSAPKATEAVAAQRTADTDRPQQRTRWFAELLAVAVLALAGSARWRRTAAVGVHGAHAVADVLPAPGRAPPFAV